MKRKKDGAPIKKGENLLIGAAEIAREWQPMSVERGATHLRAARRLVQRLRYKIRSQGESDGIIRRRTPG